MRITNISKKTVIAQNVIKADSFLSRMIGLLKHATLSPQEVLVITHCQSIHMFFMKFPIDVIFVGHDDSVIGLVAGIKPFRLSPIFFKASYAIEGAVGMIKSTKTALGDKISIQ